MGEPPKRLPPPIPNPRCTPGALRAPGPAERKQAANAFAMELLMPRAEFLKAAEGVQDLNDEPAIRKLAAKFKVTVGVAVARLIDLGGKDRNA